MKKLLVIGFLTSSIIALNCNKIFSNTPENIENNLEIEIVVKDVPLLLELQDNEIVSFTIHNKQEQTQKITGVSIKFADSDVDEILETLRLVRINNINSEEFKTEVGRTSDIRQTTKITGESSLDKNDKQFILSFTGNKNANLNSSIRIEQIAVEIDNHFEHSIDIQRNKVIRLGRVLRQRGQDNSDTYRIPGLITTGKGTLIAVYDNRYNNSKDLQEDIDVGMSRSSDGGQTWEPMRVIMDMGEWGGRSERLNGIGDPAILYDHTTGTIWVAALWMSGATEKDMLWWASKPGMSPEETGQFILSKSTDDGLTWSDPINITEQIKDPAWQLLLQGPGAGITLDDGTLVFPAQFKEDIGEKALDGGQYTCHSTIIYSKDGGETWHIGAGAKPNTTEAQVVQLSDGSLMLNMRDDLNRRVKDETNGRAVSITKDLGQTWTTHPTSNSALQEPNCMASIIGADLTVNGSKQRVLFFSNPNNKNSRTNMTIKTSLDEGNTWPEELQVELYGPSGFGYSCLTMVDESHVGIVYEGAKELYFQKIPIKDIFK